MHVTGGGERDIYDSPGAVCQVACAGGMVIVYGCCVQEHKAHRLARASHDNLETRVFLQKDYCNILDVRAPGLRMGCDVSEGSRRDVALSIQHYRGRETLQSLRINQIVKGDGDTGEDNDSALGAAFAEEENRGIVELHLRALIRCKINGAGTGVQMVGLQVGPLA